MTKKYIFFFSSITYFVKQDFKTVFYDKSYIKKIVKFMGMYHLKLNNKINTSFNKFIRNTLTCYCKYFLKIESEQKFEKKFSNNK